MQSIILARHRQYAGEPLQKYLNALTQFDKTDTITYLSRSTVTKQIVFDQQGLHLMPEFECAMDRRFQVLVSKLETLDPSLLPN